MDFFWKRQTCPALFGFPFGLWLLDLHLCLFQVRGHPKTFENLPSRPKKNTQGLYLAPRSCYKRIPLGMARLFLHRHVRLFARSTVPLALPAVLCWEGRRGDGRVGRPGDGRWSACSEEPETLCPKLAKMLKEHVLKEGRMFDCNFTASKREFDDAWKWSWALLGVVAMSRAKEYDSRLKSTADSNNRLQDKKRVESKWGLEEFGHPSCEFYDSAGELVALGYESIVYGDHGPYIEFNEQQICWPTFCNHKLKGPGRTHFEHYNQNVSIKLYDQFQTVADQPNPPADNPFSSANNRPDGYADYRPGRLYMSCDLFFSEGGRCLK